MGQIDGFMKIPRQVEGKLSVSERIKNYKEFTVPLKDEEVTKQGARCMNCGIPFCHSGCPLGNLIPDFNHAVYEKNWEKAVDILHNTNNFPEFTGRLCPAPCEEACVLGINEPAVAIENIEKEIIEHAFENNWVQANPPRHRTGKKVAIVGSGPAGMAAAQQLNSAGHTVTLFERDAKIGGLLRYGIPDFKLEKSIIDRRLKIMEEEGIIFKPNTEVGKDIIAEELDKEFDAVVLCGGATIGRKLTIEGSDLKGVHLAMDFLKQNNQRVDGITIEGAEILATDKDVIVIGGGDTGSDCIGTSIRHGAKSVTNFEIMPMPTTERPKDQPWPYYPMRLKTSTSHEEGADRFFSINTVRFNGNKEGHITSLTTIEVKKEFKDGRMHFTPIEGTEKDWPCDLALMALGFTGPETDTVIAQYGLDLDARGNVKALNYQSSKKHVFAAGDIRRGQSLIVWAISEGREAAHAVDTFLMGRSYLPTKGKGDLPRV